MIRPVWYQQIAATLDEANNYPEGSSSSVNSDPVTPVTHSLTL